MKKIVQWIVTAFVEYLALWYERKEREELEALAIARKGQLQSIKKSREMEARLSTFRDPKTLPLSPRDWNKGPRAGGSGALLLVCFLMITSGCFTRTVYVESRMPIIPRPARPVIPEDPPEWTVREELLVRYSAALEDRIDQYNDEAHKHNRSNAYE